MDITQGEETKFKRGSDSETKIQTDTKTENETERENEKLLVSNAALTSEKIEKWSIDELQNYLLSFTLTEEETLWLEKTTENFICESENDAMPFFKTILKKRLVSGSWCVALK